MLPKKILIVDDEKLIRLSLEQAFKKEDYEVILAESGEQALELLKDNLFDLALLDIGLPQMSGVELLKKIKKLYSALVVIMITADEHIKTAVDCMKIGAYDYIAKPFDIEQIKINIKKALETAKLRQEIFKLRKEQKEKYAFDSIIGESEKMQEVFRLITKVIKTDAATVLIQGESGTGKDLVAKAIHYGSQRAEKPFMEINCAALPENLLESELFGYEKGAFTDAKEKKQGLFELADEGTLFMDEVSSMPFSVQAKFLKAIETKSFRRIGGISNIKVNVRIISASNKNLADAVKENAFREDLYYRLNVVPIYLPVLRDRKDDIILLVNHFVELFNKEFKRNIKGISKKAEDLLINYSWPGNVRELKNVIERAIILESEEFILAEHLPIEMRAESGIVETKKQSVPTDAFKLPVNGISLSKVEESLVRQALDASGNNQTHAAKLLNITRDSLRTKMKKIGLL